MKRDTQNELLTLPPPASTQHGSRSSRRCSTMSAMTFTTKTTTKRSAGSLWTEAARLPACLCGRQILAAQDELLRMSAFSVGQAFDARWSSYLCRSCRTHPADDGLLLLLHWHNVSYITQASPPSYSFSACDTLLVLVYSSGGGGVFLVPSAAAEFGAGICAVPSSLCRTGDNRLFNSVLLICVRYKTATYKAHF